MEKKYIETEHFKARVMKAADELNDAAMYNVAKAICEMVDCEDAAEVMPVVHGEWEFISMDGSLWCSNFKRPSGHGRKAENKHCRICGAKMDLNKESSESPGDI